MKMTSVHGQTVLGIALVTTALLGCQFDTQGVTPYDGATMDAELLPDGGVEAGVQPDGGGGCINGAQRCFGASVELCVDTQWTEFTVCDWGCNTSVPGHPYCGTPLWAETVNPQVDVGTGVWLAEPGVTIINSDDGTITTPSGPLMVDYEDRVHYRSDGLGAVTILGFAQITIPVGAHVEVVGTRALALVASGSIVIGGELMAQGHSDGTAGPGGYPGGLGGGFGGGPGGGEPGNKDGAATHRSGAGGGGHTGVGGPGGTVTPILGDPTSGGLGGGVVVIDPVAGPLVGGHGGGSTAGDILGMNTAAGGGGGGALMIAAQVSVEVLSTGVVNAGGGGGSSRGGGAGGGSGGMLLIQAHSCVIEGVVAANGGGGGDIENGVAGAAGSSGDLATPGGGAHGGAGGAGSDLTGANGTSNEFNGGGGGGAAGFIRIDTVLPPDIDLGTLSPHESTVGHVQNAFPTT